VSLIEKTDWINVRIGSLAVEISINLTEQHMVEKCVSA